MRQVPVVGAAPIGIVGDGRVSRHLRHYLALLDLPWVAWSRRSPGSGPLAALAPCRTVVLLFRDDDIVPFVNAWPALREKQLVHFSGSLVTDLVEGAHPLMTFGPSLYDLETYRRIPFVLDAGRAPLHVLLPGLPNPWFAIPASERPYYHALCVMAGNFATLLWQKLFDEFRERFAIPPDAAFPYLGQLTANVLNDPSTALTGPLARGDAGTIRANLAALQGDPFHDVYDAFVRAHARRA